MIIIKKRIYISVFMLMLFLLPCFSAKADTLGQHETFFVDKKFDKSSRSSLPATLRKITDKLYFYVDDSYWDSLDPSRQDALLSNASLLAIEFESNIYPKEVKFWGSEPNPGIDGDTRITILLEQLISSNGGDFSSANQFLRSAVPTSNQREMMFINAEVLLLNLETTKVFLAHEFQHLISFNQKEAMRHIYEDTWLNEIRSEYSATLVGYNDFYPNSNLEKRAEDFLEDPADSLTEWPNTLADYAIANMFGEYLIEQFPDILSETIKSSLGGIDSINEYLQKHGRYEKFGDLFVYWMSAVYFNNVNIDSRLGYFREGVKNIHITPQQSVYISQNLTSYNISQFIKDWQPLWIEFNIVDGASDISRSFKINISGELDQKYVSSILSIYDNGLAKLSKVNISGGAGEGYVVNSADKKLRKILVLAAKATETSDFGIDEKKGLVNIKISNVSTQDAKANNLSDGTLIKRPNEKEIYVIWGKYKRYLNPEVINLYGHLNPANAVELEPEIFDSYISSNYVKYVGDEKVYAVWPDNTKHWLHITPQQWDASNRDWNAIFTINDLELNHYKLGSDITR